MECNVVGDVRFAGFERAFNDRVAPVFDLNALCIVQPRTYVVVIYRHLSQAREGVQRADDVCILLQVPDVLSRRLNEVLEASQFQ